ncbi:DeoR/GlpR family DNA-binding transcription regulator [Pseudonocardia sp. CA-107938]|uniref:DeoR/GlpR family DNA-binding transcription regulator n=1 Tax=Pseudonocardia sp. CA-107938 TaxID=3240021 RepID=UPI003D8F70C0
MLARQRQGLILDEVRTAGGVRVSELVDRLGVSDMTIRRDIEVLAGRGLVARVHGGATSVAEPRPTTRAAARTEAERAIAAAAATLVEPGSSVAMSAGPTTTLLAAALSSIPRLTVVTNSLPVAAVLHETGRADLAVVLTGGERTASDALVGPVAVAALAGLHVDRLFLGVHGMDATAGFTAPGLAEAATDRALIRSARSTTVLAASATWGVVGLSTIAALDDVDLVVTDDGLDPHVREILQAECGDLVLAGAAPRGLPPAAAISVRSRDAGQQRSPVS